MLHCVLQEQSSGIIWHPSVAVNAVCGAWGSSKSLYLATVTILENSHLILG